MSRCIGVRFLALIATVASTVLASAQVMSSPTEPGNQTLPGTPVAYVYVAGVLNSSDLVVNAYSAASDGRLTLIPGSPFSAKASGMALTSHWLFATDGIDIWSYSIASNGALKQVDSFTAGTTSGGPVNLFLDHTGANLYDGYINLQGTGNSGYQTYGIDKTSGKINLLEEVGASPTYSSRLSFVSSNQYAYSASCYHFDPIIFGFKRNGDGTLTELSGLPPLPSPPANDFYCPYLASADPFGHLAVAVQATNDSSWLPDGQPQIAVYSVDSAGKLTTRSTSTNMPRTSVTQITDFWMAPSGKLLAVAGTTGLQVFHFNGGSQVSHYTGLLTKNQVDHVYWDNSNHLYAVSQKAGKLYVFTVTPTSYSQAPGSPYSLSDPFNVVVLPKN